MKHFFRLIIFTALFFEAGILQAQNITGSWEGIMSGEKLQMNIKQKGNELCGYTHDYELNNDYSYCTANFEGRYDSEKKIYFTTGTDFIENSGGHVLMRIILWKNKFDPKNILRGKVYIESGAMSLFGMGGDDVILKKISNSPKRIYGTGICFPEPIKKVIVNTTPVKPVIKKPIVPKPVPSKPVKVFKVLPVKKDTTQKTIPKPVKPVIIPVKPTALERVMATRKQNQQSRITIDVKEINLKLYDNGTVDNDSVSIFYNGRLLLSHQRLSEKAIELNIQLDEGVTQHEITMFAENLGTIAPNTALVVVTAGNKRYELHSKASMEENAVLVFDYKPK